MSTTLKTDRAMLEMRRTLNAPVERVYQAWTDPAQIPKWFGCAQTSKVLLQQDLQVGGQFRVQLTGEDGGELSSMFGTYLEVTPNKKLVYTWNNTSTEFPAKDTLVTVEFIDKGSQTELILTHSKFDRPVSVEGHTFGWGAALEKLAALFD